jgi:hypothetical protein
MTADYDKRFTKIEKDIASILVLLKEMNRGMVVMDKKLDTIGKALLSPIEQKQIKNIACRKTSKARPVSKKGK